MAGHEDLSLPNQVASIDTLIARKLLPPADLIVIDEAHHSGSRGYREFLSHYSTAFIIAVTATPWVRSGLSHVADSIVNPVNMKELISQGYLAPFRYFAPHLPDLSNVAISRNEYVVDQLDGVMKPLTGDIIEHWKRLSGKPTLCFAVTVSHSKMLVERFKAQGIPAEHCDADTKDSTRLEIIGRLERGDTRVICNVGILSTGVDIPCIETIIMARPTRSRNLYIQQIGRGSRTSPGKSTCIILDHSGNILRFGFPTDESEVRLHGFKREKIPRESKICHYCFAVYRGGTCGECGKSGGTLSQNPEEGSGKLEEVTDIDFILREYKRLKNMARDRGYMSAWACHQLIKSYTFEKAEPYLPQWFLSHYDKEDPFAHSPHKGVKK